MKILKKHRNNALRLLAMLWVCLFLVWPLQAFQPEPEKTKSGKTPITQRDYSNTEIEMADAWRANGKIYVVVATLGALIGGLALYLVLLDRRISKLEKDLES
jgi:hypothetical protein